MVEKWKAAITYFLSAAAYITLGVDVLTTVNLAPSYNIAALVVGAIAGAFGIFWTNPKK